MRYNPDYQYIPPFKWPILTQVYDYLCLLGGFGSKFRKKVLASSPLTDGMIVADIGCGTGVFLKIAKKRYPRARFIGFDPDQQALGIAGHRLAAAGLTVELKAAFAESLPLPDESVDVCFNTLAFHHMPDDIKQQAITEIYRVLKPGGRVVIADFGENHSVFFRKLLFFEKLEHLQGNLNGLLPRFLSEMGFKNLEKVGQHFPAIKIIRAIK